MNQTTSPDRALFSPVAPSRRDFLRGLGAMHEVDRDAVRPRFNGLLSSPDRVEWGVAGSPGRGFRRGAGVDQAEALVNVMTPAVRAEIPARGGAALLVRDPMIDVAL